MNAYLARPQNATLAAHFAFSLFVNFVLPASLQPGTPALLRATEAIFLAFPHRDAAWAKCPGYLEIPCIAVPLAHPRLNARVILGALNFGDFERLKLVGDVDACIAWVGRPKDRAAQKARAWRRLAKKERCKGLVEWAVKTEFRVDGWFSRSPEPGAGAAILGEEEAGAVVAPPLDEILGAPNDVFFRTLAERRAAADKAAAKKASKAAERPSRTARRAAAKKKKVSEGMKGGDEALPVIGEEAAAAPRQEVPGIGRTDFLNVVMGPVAEAEQQVGGMDPAAGPPYVFFERELDALIKKSGDQTFPDVAFEHFPQPQDVPLPVDTTCGPPSPALKGNPFTDWKKPDVFLPGENKDFDDGFARLLGNFQDFGRNLANQVPAPPGQHAPNPIPFVFAGPGGQLPTATSPEPPMGHFATKLQPPPGIRGQRSPTGPEKAPVNKKVRSATPANRPSHEARSLTSASSATIQNRAGSDDDSEVICETPRNTTKPSKVPMTPAAGKKKANGDNSFSDEHGIYDATPIKKATPSPQLNGAGKKDAKQLTKEQRKEKARQRKLRRQTQKAQEEEKKRLLDEIKAAELQKRQAREKQERDEKTREILERMHQKFEEDRKRQAEEEAEEARRLQEAADEEERNKVAEGQRVVEEAAAKKRQAELEQARAEKRILEQAAAEKRRVLEQAAAEKQRVLDEAAVKEKQAELEQAAAEEKRLLEQAAAEKRQAKLEQAAAEKQRVLEQAAAEKQRILEQAAAEKKRILEQAAAEKQRVLEQAAAEEKQRLEKEAATKEQLRKEAEEAAAEAQRLREQEEQDEKKRLEAAAEEERLVQQAQQAAAEAQRLREQAEQDEKDRLEAAAAEERHIQQAQQATEEQLAREAAARKAKRSRDKAAEEERRLEDIKAANEKKKQLKKEKRAEANQKKKQQRRDADRAAAEERRLGEEVDRAKEEETKRAADERQEDAELVATEEQRLDDVEQAAAEIIQEDDAENRLQNDIDLLRKGLGLPKKTEPVPEEIFWNLDESEPEDEQAPDANQFATEEESFLVEEAKLEAVEGHDETKKVVKHVLWADYSSSSESLYENGECAVDLEHETCLDDRGETETFDEAVEDQEKFDGDVSTWLELAAKPNIDPQPTAAKPAAIDAGDAVDTDDDTVPGDALEVDVDKEAAPADAWLELTAPSNVPGMPRVVDMNDYYADENRFVVQQILKYGFWNPEWRYNQSHRGRGRSQSIPRMSPSTAGREETRIGLFRRRVAS
jgi:colicin import membrane protein